MIDLSPNKKHNCHLYDRDSLRYSRSKKRKPFLLSCPAAVFLSFQKQKKYVWTSNSSFTTFPNQYLKASITFESSHEK